MKEINFLHVRYQCYPPTSFGYPNAYEAINNTTIII